MKNENTAKFLSGFAAIVGRPNVGKSTLMNAMVGEKVAIVSNRPQTTRNRIMGVATDKGWQIVFLDTPGLHKPRTRLGEYMVKSVQDAMDGIDVLLVLVDANEIGPQDRAIVEEMSARKVKKILVLNKTDIVEEARLMAAIQSFAEAGYDAIVPISARTGKGVDELKKLEKLSVIIKPFRKKRSLSANAYFHVLITKIAEKVGTSKAEAKNLMIGRYGQPELIKGDIAVLKTNVPTDIMYKKEDVHTVAIGRRLEKGKEVVFYRLMRGSHTYDSREMSELIKGTIQEAEDLGIETLTPRELEQILGKWKPRKEEEK